MERINTWLDTLPRETLWASGRGVPAFRTMGVIGFHAAVALLAVGAVRLGRPLSAAFGAAVICAAGFFLWALLRRWLVRREKLVLLEHAWFAMASVALYMVLIHEPVWPWLDAAAVALCGFLTFGRIGCLLAGCCHGQPSSFGIRYARPTHPADGIRLFPVQGVEAACLAVLTIGGLAGLGSGRPGDVFLTIAVLYAVVRFGTEGLRGDSRSRLFGVPVARIMVCLQLAGAIAVDEFVRQPVSDPARYLPAAVGLAVCAVAGLRWRRPRPISVPAASEIRRLAAATTGSEPTADPVAHDLGEGATAVASGLTDGWHLSVSVKDGPGGAAERLSEAALGERPDVVTERDIAHTFVRASGTRFGYFNARHGPDTAESPVKKS